MHRRTLLTACSAVLASGGVGCLGDMGTTGGPDEDTQTSTATKTEPDETTDTNTMTREAQFEVIATSQRSQEETAAVTFGETTIEIEGTIKGRNGCYTARLDEITITDGTLTVAVESYEDREDDEVCTEAIVYIDYQVIAPDAGDSDQFDEVTVTHNGDAVTTKVAT
jgi:hypothetical protein